MDPRSGERCDQEPDRLPAPGRPGRDRTPNANSEPYASDQRKSLHPFEYDPQRFRSLLDETFERVAIKGMTDEAVGAGFLPMAWYLMAICWT